MKDSFLIRGLKKVKKRIRLAKLFESKRTNNEVLVIDLPRNKKGGSKSLDVLYPYLWFAENCQYFSQKIVFFGVGFSFLNGFQRKAFYSPLNPYAVFELRHTFDSYFEVIQPSERALIRKSIKNGFTCREIQYDDFLEEIREINTSKTSRGGRPMSEDYVHPRKRDAVVKPYNSQIFTYGIFSPEDKLVAYYMFELITNFFHTAKGIGHKDYLSYGVMNHLFAYSVSELTKLQLARWVVYGVATHDPNDGLSRFKRNVGCSEKYLMLKGKRKAFDQVNYLSKNYVLHGDTALNFITDYESPTSIQQSV